MKERYTISISDRIQKEISNFDWEKAFYNVVVNKIALFFNEAILIVIYILVLHNPATCDNKDLPWITSLIGKAISNKYLIYKRFEHNKDFTNDKSNLERFLQLQNNSSSLIKTTTNFSSKITSKLSYPKIGLKNLLPYSEVF